MGWHWTRVFFSVSPPFYPLPHISSSISTPQHRWKMPKQRSLGSLEFGKEQNLYQHKALYIEVRWHRAITYWLCNPARVWYYSLVLSNSPPNKIKVLKEELWYLRMWDRIKSNTITRIGTKITPWSSLFCSFIFQHTDMWIVKESITSCSLYYQQSNIKANGNSLFY